MLLLPILGGSGKYTIYFRKKKKVPGLCVVFDGSQQQLGWLWVPRACYLLLTLVVMS